MNIREVAKRAGVSTATVSRVVNGTVPVTPRTERRVREAIKTLGYFPNSHARTLGSGKSHMYGLIISDISNPFFPDIAKGFERIAVEHGQELLIANTDYQPQRMQVCVRRMLERKVDGVAIMTSEMDTKLIQLLSKRGIPIVFLDTGKVGPKTSNVFIDYEGGVESAVDYLVSLGHRRIGFVSGPPTLPSAKKRTAAFLRSLSKHGIASDPACIEMGDHHIDGGRKAMESLLKLNPRPTAVLASNDLSAIGVLGAIRDAGLRVPEDISVMGFDDIELSSFLYPPLSTIRVPRTEIASRAFAALYAASHKGVEHGVEYCISTELVIRQSTGVVKGSQA